MTAQARAALTRRLAEPHPVLDEILDEFLAHPERVIAYAFAAAAALALLGRSLSGGPS